MFDSSPRSFAPHLLHSVFIAIVIIEYFSFTSFVSFCDIMHFCNMLRLGWRNDGMEGGAVPRVWKVKHAVQHWEIIKKTTGVPLKCNRTPC